MMKLRKEAQMLKIKGYSVMNKDELSRAIAEKNTKATQTNEDNIYCANCLEKQQLQRYSDMAKKAYDANTVYCHICCDYCPTISDGEIYICSSCFNTRSCVEPLQQ